MDRSALAERFHTFGALSNHGVPRMYVFLCERIANDLDLLSLADCTKPGQPPPNMLFGAVHYLLLSGLTHPLSRYYPSLSADALQPDEYLWQNFRSFCFDHRHSIAEILAQRRTQTNEVGRSALLIPAFTYLADLLPGRSWHQIEIGASAGFNLNWDAYTYRFGSNVVPPGAPGPEELFLTTHLRGPAPLPDIDISHLTRVMAMRIGVETHPLDMSIPESRLWLQALTWPDRPDRILRLNQAIKIAANRPPQLLAGDGVQLLPEILAAVPSDEIPLVFHSFVRYQFSETCQAAFTGALKAAAKYRTIAHLAIEWLGSADPSIDLTIYHYGRERHLQLGTCHPHGDWLEWRPRERAR